MLGKQMNSTIKQTEPGVSGHNQLKFYELIVYGHEILVTKVTFSVPGPFYQEHQLLISVVMVDVE